MAIPKNSIWTRKLAINAIESCTPRNKISRLDPAKKRKIPGYIDVPKAIRIVGNSRHGKGWIVDKIKKLFPCRFSFRDGEIRVKLYFMYLVDGKRRKRICELEPIRGDISEYKEFSKRAKKIRLDILSEIERGAIKIAATNPSIKSEELRYDNSNLRSQWNAISETGYAIFRDSTNKKRRALIQIDKRSLLMTLGGQGTKQITPEGIKSIKDLAKIIGDISNSKGFNDTKLKMEEWRALIDLFRKRTGFAPISHAVFKKGVWKTEMLDGLKMDPRSGKQSVERPKRAREICKQALEDRFDIKLEKDDLTF